MTENKKYYDSYLDAKFDTTPVKVNHAFRGDSYTPLEWKLRQCFDRMGNDQWDNSTFESDLTKLEL